MEEAKNRGLRAAIVRFSNVYGGVGDHADRVVPAFARAAVSGTPLRLDGPACAFDFTHIDDTVRGVVAMVDMLASGRLPPPVHLLTGTPTTLQELATMATALAGERTPVVEAPPRSFDVSAFHGDPTRARELLGWAPRVALRDGLGRLVRHFRAEAGRSLREEAAL